MADYTGSIGLNISEFEEGISELMSEIPALEAELKQLNAQMAILERTGKATGAEYIRMQRIQKDLGATLNDSKRQLASFNQVVGESPSKLTAVTKGFSALKSSLVGLGITLTVGGLLAAGRALFTFSRELKDASTLAGVLPENLQRIQSALSGSLSAQDSASALKSLNDAMRDAIAGSIEAEYKLSQLGVTMDDIRKKSPDQVFLQIADRVKEAKNPLEAIREVVGLFGEDIGLKLIPALQKGGAEIKAMMDAAHVASNQQVDDAARGARALEAYGNTVKRVALSSIGWLEKMRKSATDSLIAYEHARFRAANPGVRAYETGGPNDPRAMNPANYRGGRRVQGSGESKSAPAVSTRIGSSALDAELQYLEEQAKIASQIVPDYIKQGQLLESQRKSLEAKLSILDKSRVLERQQLELQIAQNVEAERAWKLAADLTKIQAKLNISQATQGRGHEEEQRVALEKINSLREQYYAMGRKGEREQQAAILSELNSEMKAYRERNEQYSDTMQSLERQTNEVEAQAKGLTALAKTYETIDKYQASILQAQRSGNAEAAAMLKKQSQLAQQAQLAAANRETAGERTDARFEGRRERRAAKNQRAQEDEALRRYNSGRRGRRIDELLSSKQARERADKEQQTARVTKDTGLSEIKSAVEAIKNEITKN